MDSKFFIALGVFFTIFSLIVAVTKNPLYIIFVAAGAFFTRMMIAEHRSNKE